MTPGGEASAAPDVSIPHQRSRHHALIRLRAGVDARVGGAEDGRLFRDVFAAFTPDDEHARQDDHR